MYLFQVTLLVAGFITITSAIDQSSDDDINRTVRSLGALVSLTTDSESDYNPFAVINRLLNAEVINTVVGKLFNVVEFKLNVLVALKRLFTYENVRSGLIFLRRISNFLLKLCTFINRFVSEYMYSTYNFDHLQDCRS